MSAPAISGSRASLLLHRNPADMLLSRLTGVQKYGSGWRARCPSHGSDKNRALSVAVGDDGRALINCFAGCASLDVLHAIGLEMADLFPERITHASTPAQRRELGQAARQAQWAAALDVLTLEARIVGVAADQIAGGDPLDDGDRVRLGMALKRINDAREVLHGR